MISTAHASMKTVCYSDLDDIVVSIYIGDVQVRNYWLRQRKYNATSRAVSRNHAVRCPFMASYSPEEFISILRRMDFDTEEVETQLKKLGW
jgi:hypothetical protein